MCYNKLHIDVSKRCRYYYFGHSQKCCFDVPCGVCEDCISDAQKDYFVRMKSEFDKCVADGGKVAFVTFTYRDDAIPAYTYHYDEDTHDIFFDKVNVKTTQLPFVYSFNRSNLQRFFNSYRKRFERFGIKSPFRYIVVGEYGTDTKFTQRSHFHALIYYSAAALRKLRLFAYNDSVLEQCILDEINELWQHGNCSKSKNKSLFLANSDACSYCSKYISKTMTLANLRRFAIFRDFIAAHFNKLEPDGYNFSPSIDGYFRHYLKQIGSNLYTLKSKNFGACALDPIRSVKDYDSQYELFKQGYPYQSNGSTKYIGFSMYYYRKLCYNVRDDGTFYLNTRGRVFQYKILSEAVQNIVNQIKTLDYRQLQSNDYEFVNDFLRRTPLFMIAYYRLFSHNRCYPRDNRQIYNRLRYYYNNREFNDISFDTLFNYQYDHLSCPYIACPRDTDYTPFSNTWNCKHSRFSPPFVIADYNYFLDLFDSLISKSKESKSLEKKQLRDMSRYLRDINNTYLYTIEPKTL